VRLLETSEILNLVEYERVRETRRREIIDLKRRRRVSVGRYLTFVFENRETVWFQVQEMVRAERIVEAARIADASQIKPVLDKLLGIDTRDYVTLTVGPHVVVGDFESGHSDEERGKLSAVHFVRFKLSPEARRIFREAEVALVVEHPNERARTVLADETTRALLHDLS